MTRTCARIFFAALAVLLMPAILSVPVGCSSSGDVVDDEYDRKIRRSYLQPRQLAFFESRFQSDREEMDDYIEAFSSDKLSGVMKNELVQLCRDSDPILGANLAYMLARASIERVIPFLKEELASDDRYVRWRALLSIAPGWADQFKSNLLPLTGADEEDPEVRKLAREKYRAIVTAGDFQMLYDALASEQADDESFRDFVTSCLLESLRAMDPLQRNGRTDALARAIGEGSAWQDAFTLELLAGKVPAEAVPALIRLYISTDRPATMRRLAVLEVWRHTQGGTPVPDDLADELRAQAIRDLMAGAFDPDKLADLLRGVGLDDESIARLAEWLADANIGNVDDATPATVVGIRLLADLAPPSGALASRLIEATANPQLEYLAVTKLVELLETGNPDLPRDSMTDAVGQGLESDDEATCRAAAIGLAQQDGDAALELLLDALKSDRETVVDLATDALVEHGDREALRELEIDLCDIIRLDGPRPMAAFNIIAGLRLLELVGGEYTLDFMGQYCRPEDATVDVAVQLERTREAIEQRLDR